VRHEYRQRGRDGARSKEEIGMVSSEQKFMTEKKHINRARKGQSERAVHGGESFKVFKKDHKWQILGHVWEKIREVAKGVRERNGVGIGQGC